MDLVIVSLISAFLAMLGTAGGWFLGSQAGRRAAVDSEASLLAKFTALNTSMANVAAQCSEYMERANVAVQRVASEKSNIARRQQREEAAGPEIADEAAYKAHLGKGGQILPDVEAALGLNR